MTDGTLVPTLLVALKTITLALGGVITYFGVKPTDGRVPGRSAPSRSASAS